MGQANYGAAKAGIAAFTIISAMELGRYGVTVNAIAPTALTRMTEDLAGMETLDAKQVTPDHISPLVVWLGSEASAEVTGRVFAVMGGKITVLEGWVNGPVVEREGKWDPAELTEVVPDLVRSAASNADMVGERV
jgi:NAD(P)-dependent dehydrogenase (short-subunit alcohol dehydrogenase family)